MKPIKKRWLSLAAAPFALAFLAFAQPAQAADYTGNCAFIPNHVTGNATVSDTACVIDTGATLIVDGTLTIDADSVDVKSEIQSVGKVTIRTNGGGELKLRKKASSQNSDILLQSPQNRIDTKGLEAGNSVQVDAGLNGAEGSTWDVKVDGQIIVNKLQSSPTNPNIHANVLLRAAGPISTKTIKTDGDLGPSSVKSGGVQIEAYRNGAGAANASEFVIGGSGYPNGVNGNIITQSTIGGGTSASFVNGGVYVTMGGRFNTGNIRVEDASAIKVRATQSRSGWIILNANAGSIFLPAGNLNASGDDTNNSGAGLIYLMAKTLDTQPGTIISANQTETAAGTGHQIFIAVETLKYRGNGTDGLKILNDGNGGGGFFSLVNVSPYGYLVPGMLTSNVNQMPWTFTLGSAELALDGPLTIDGTEGNGQLLMRADGNTAAVNVSGYPLAFNGGDVTVRSRGQTLHRINVGFFGTVNGTRQGLTVNNVGNWTLDANGKAPAAGGAAAGGIIQVKADQTSLTALDSATDPSSGNIVIRANGDDTNGDGGIISVDTQSFVLGDTTHAAIRADGAPNGTGNAVKNPLDSAGPFAVTLKTGSSNLILGGGNKAIRVTANGGKISGNGGTVKILPANSNVRIRDSLAVDVSAIGTNCGTCVSGDLQIISNKIQGNLGTAPNATALLANGAGSGSGGNIDLRANAELTVASDVEANGGCDLGSGGTISLTGTSVTTTGKVGAEGSGGSSCLAVAAKVPQSGSTLLGGPGSGGTIKVNGCTTYGISGVGLIVDANDNGNGGDIAINCTESVTVAASVSANGAMAGKGGSININTGTGELILGFQNGNPKFLANGGTTGSGGQIQVTTSVVSNLTAELNTPLFESQGFGAGEGGKVTINNPNVKFRINDVIKVASGDAAGPTVFGGSIKLKNVEVFRYKTGESTFPKALWSLNPGSLSTTDSQIIAAAIAMPAGMKTIYETDKIELYALYQPTEWQDFFSDPLTTLEVLGVTDYEFRTVTVFLQLNSGVRQTTVHELGHALERSQNLAASPAYIAALADQRNDFNSVDCFVAFAGTSYVSACTQPYANNWEVLKAKVIVSQNDRELFTQLFEYQGNSIFGYPVNVERITVFDRLTSMFGSTAGPGYMDLLWSSY